MSPFAEQIRLHLAMFRQGDQDKAFHGLLEMDHAGLADLETTYRATPDREARRFLLRVIWQHRQPSILPLLAEALLDPEPRVWREALDGLVTFADPASVAALRAAQERRRDEEFQKWVNEAIEQAEANVDTSADFTNGE